MFNARSSSSSLRSRHWATSRVANVRGIKDGQLWLGRFIDWFGSESSTSSVKHTHRKHTTNQPTVTHSYQLVAFSHLSRAQSLSKQSKQTSKQTHTNRKMANNKSSSLHKLGSLLLALTLAICVVVIVAEAKSISTNAADESVSAVIPSPNQEYGDTSSVYERDDIERRSPQQQVASLVEQQESEAASNEAAVPVYVSPFVRSERQSAVASFDPQESSHAPLNYAPRPSASIHLAASAPQTKDLKTSASYGK